MSETIRRANAKQRVLDALQAYRVRTNVELLTVCFRYGSRIHELRREGHVIHTQALGGGLYAYHYLGQTTTPELPF